MQLTGAEIFLESLKREGVDTIFALPGGVVLKIFDVLHQQKDIRVILTRHEQGAGLMAHGKTWGGLDYLWPRDDQCYHGASGCLYGFCSGSLFCRTSPHWDDWE